jgi:hypothetical protein
LHVRPAFLDSFGTGEPFSVLLSEDFVTLASTLAFHVVDLTDEPLGEQRDGMLRLAGF